MQTNYYSFFRMFPYGLRSTAFSLSILWDANVLFKAIRAIRVGNVVSWVQKRYGKNGTKGASYTASG